jgi:hypothetical protein
MPRLLLLGLSISTTVCCVVVVCCGLCFQTVTNGHWWGVSGWLGVQGTALQSLSCMNFGGFDLEIGWGFVDQLPAQQQANVTMVHGPPVLLLLCWRSSSCELQAVLRHKLVTEGLSNVLESNSRSTSSGRASLTIRSAGPPGVAQGDWACVLHSTSVLSHRLSSVALPCISKLHAPLRTM